MIPKMDNLLFPYQRRILNDTSKYILWEKSRRIGGTFSMAVVALLHCLTKKENAWFSSSDEKNAREFIQYVYKFAEIINLILGVNYINLKDSTSEVVYLPNGMRISSLSSNPTALRGKDGLIILDEFALHEDQEELYRAAHGCVAQKGRLIILSTHNGGGTLFYKFATEKNHFTKYKTTIKDACEEGYAVRFAKEFHKYLPDVDKLNKEYILSLQQTALNRESFGQEFLCEPVSMSSLIVSEAYDKCIVDSDIPNFLDHNRAYRDLFIGIDVGRTRDLTVVWVIERLLNKEAVYEWDRYDYRTVCILSIQNETMNTQFERIKPILSHRDVAGIRIDQGTVGRALADLVVAEFPQAEVVNFSNPRKAELAERVKGYVELTKVSLPSDKLIKDDILAVKRVMTGKHNQTVGYEGGTKDSHSDHFWALSLALDSATNGNNTILVG